MIEVFKTNIRRKKEANFIIRTLKVAIPYSSIHIDLEDCDKVLKVEVKNKVLDENEIVRLLTEHNFHCEVLDY